MRHTKTPGRQTFDGIAAGRKILAGAVIAPPSPLRTRQPQAAGIVRQVHRRPGNFRYLLAARAPET
jgi:hypothetical protein